MFPSPLKFTSPQAASCSIAAATDLGIEGIQGCVPSPKGVACMYLKEERTMLFAHEMHYKQCNLDYVMAWH